MVGTMLSGSGKPYSERQASTYHASKGAQYQSQPAHSHLSHTCSTPHQSPLQQKHTPQPTPPHHQLHTLTAACPPSLVRYRTRSSRALRAHSLHHTRRTQKNHVEVIYTPHCSTHCTGSSHTTPQQQTSTDSNKLSANRHKNGKGHFQHLIRTYIYPAHPTPHLLLLSIAGPLAYRKVCYKAATCHTLKHCVRLTSSSALHPCSEG